VSRPKNPYIRRRAAQDRERRKAGMNTGHRKLPVVNRAALHRELFQILNFTQPFT
jgi:hypothetical protein